VRWGRFDALLTGDAEAELAPLETRAVDVLKVAHHGSADAGLGALLERTQPGLALISVGVDNPYGHPDPGTLATLSASGAQVMRTDESGDLVVEVARSRWWVR
jgi:competence protein ComEC